MDLKERIKPISYLKANTTESVSSFDAGQDEAIILTQNGEAKTATKKQPMSSTSLCSWPPGAASSPT